MQQRLDLLNRLDGLREIHFGDCKTFVHRRHRWTLAIVWLAQDAKLLPRPCDIIVFDRHSDALSLANPESVEAVRANGLQFDDLVKLCAESLRPFDDDWIQAGMYLGIFRNTVVFTPGGAPEDSQTLQLTDAVGCPHRLDVLDMPRRELGYGGKLSERAPHDDSLWRWFGWDEQGGRHWFHSQRESLALDFDLDCFAIEAGEYRLPWYAEMFEREFLAPSSHPSTEGRTGAQFVAALAERAALLTFAAEPRYCGDGLDPGPHVGRIFDDVNAYLFGGRLFSHL